MSTPRAALVHTQKLAGATFEAVQTALRQALRDAYPPKETSGDPYCGGPWPRDVWDDSAVFENEGKLWRVGYAFADGVVTLNGSPEQVQVEYVPAGAAAPPPAPGGEGVEQRLDPAAKVDATLAKLAKRATPAKKG